MPRGVKAGTAGAVPDPFASAARKPTAASKDEAPVIVAGDFTTYSGAKYGQAEVVQAIKNIAQAKEYTDSAKAMDKSARPILMGIGRTSLAKFWLEGGRRPSSPKFVTNPDGSGIMLSFIVQNKAMKMDATTYGRLSNLIGAKAAEEYTVERDDFVLNPDVLPMDAQVKGKDGKVTTQNVMEALRDAIMDKFGPSPEMVSKIFQIVPKFETTKGLLDMGPKLVAPDSTPASVMRLAQFLEVGRFTTQIKVGSGGDDDSED